MKRLPNKNEIITVYAVGVTILYSWAMIVMIKDSFPRWGLYFNIIDLFILLSYILLGSFVESLLVMAGLIIIYIALPQKMFAERFVLRASILTVTFLGAIIYYYTQSQLESFIDYRWGIFFAIATLILIVLAETIAPIARFIEELAARCIIFLYIYLPLSLIGIVLIIFRNLR